MPAKRLKELALLFFKLGCTAFGGPAAHIAMMHDEVVRKRQWFSDSHFLDLIGATNLIPGPNSTEMAIHIGQERAGWKGLIVAGCCFIFPAVIITGMLAWLYKDYGQLPQVQPFIYGVKPAILAVILAAVYPLAQKSLKTIPLQLIGVGVLVLSLAHYNELLLLFGAGFLGMSLQLFRDKQYMPSTFVMLLLPLRSEQVPNKTQLFLIFLKIGAVLYGSGYVLFAFLDSELVATGILPRQQLIDAIAVGQFTPGPVFSSVTFIGYQIDGASGALIATVGVFLPSFVFVALLNPIVRMMRNSTLFASFLDAVNVASIAIIVAVCYTMGVSSITDWRTELIAVLSLVICFGFRKVNSAFIVLGGSLLGAMLFYVL